MLGSVRSFFIHGHLCLCFRITTRSTIWPKKKFPHLTQFVEHPQHSYLALGTAVRSQSDTWNCTRREALSCSSAAAAFVILSCLYLHAATAMEIWTKKYRAAHFKTRTSEAYHIASTRTDSTATRAIVRKLWKNQSFFAFRFFHDFQDAQDFTKLRGPDRLRGVEEEASEKLVKI